jgi:hypothetical protein
LSGLEGAVDSGPYEVQWQAWRRPVPRVLNSVGVVVAVRGVAQQGRGWPHRVDSEGDGAPARPDVMVCPCVVTRKGFEGAAAPHSRARRASRTGVGGTVSRS